MRFSSHQSVFLPWAGFWHKAAASDLMIINSGSDFCRQDYEHRVQVNDAWLTLSIDRDKTGKKISQVVLKEGTCKEAAQRLYRDLYTKRNPYRSRLDGIFGILHNYEGTSLKALNELLILEMAVQLRVATSMVFIDEVPHGTSKTEKLYNRVSRYMRQDDTYLCGYGATAYLDLNTFGFNVAVQKPVASAIDTNSMLGVMVKHENPIEHIRPWFEYSEKGDLND